jgi:uncharacterized protein YndB with AHSA1/START domain
MKRATEAPGTSTAPGTVRLERLLPGPVERVWAYLTESEKRGRWLAPGVMELRPGGRVELRFRHADLSAEQELPEKYAEYAAGHVMHGTVLACEPPRLLSYSWGDGEEDSEVTFELSPRGDEVLLVVTQRKLRSREDMVSVAAGWDAHVGILIDVLAARAPRGFWSTHGRLEAEYAARFAGAAGAAGAPGAAEHE